MIKKDHMRAKRSHWCRKFSAYNEAAENFLTYENNLQLSKFSYLTSLIEHF
jgi:hypothetical protein